VSSNQIKTAVSSKAKATALVLGLIGITSSIVGCNQDTNTITTAEALKKASTNYVCPPGLVVAFESKESNLGSIEAASKTSKKFFNDIDCSKPEGISLASQIADIKSWLPFIGTEVNNGVVLVNGQPKAVKYKDPSGKFSFEPIRTKEDAELDIYFKSQGFQTQSKDASKNILGQKWDLYDTKAEDFVRKQYVKDGIVKGTPTNIKNKKKVN
jgi:hypothetical protein